MVKIFALSALAAAVLTGAVLLTLRVSSNPLCQSGFHPVTTTKYTYAYRYLPMTGKWGMGWGNDSTTVCVEGVR